MNRLYFLLVCFPFVIVGCENDIAAVNELFRAFEPGVEIATEIDMLYSDSALVRVRVQGPTLVRHLDKLKPHDEFPEGLHVDFMEDDGSISSTLDAEHGDRFTREKKVIVRDNVVLRNTKGEILETNELIWDELKGEVYTERFVRITKPDEIILAYGFRANQSFTEYELRKVVAKLKADEFQEELKN